MYFVSLEAYERILNRSLLSVLLNGIADLIVTTRVGKGYILRIRFSAQILGKYFVNLKKKIYELQFASGNNQSRIQLHFFISPSMNSYMKSIKFSYLSIIED